MAKFLIRPELGRSAELVDALGHIIEAIDSKCCMNNVESDWPDYPSLMDCNGVVGEISGRNPFLKLTSNSHIKIALEYNNVDVIKSWPVGHGVDVTKFDSYCMHYANKSKDAVLALLQRYPDFCKNAVVLAKKHMSGQGAALARLLCEIEWVSASDKADLKSRIDKLSKIEKVVGEIPYVAPKKNLVEPRQGLLGNKNVVPINVNVKIKNTIVQPLILNRIEQKEVGKMSGEFNGVRKKIKDSKGSLVQKAFDALPDFQNYSKDVVEKLGVNPMLTSSWKSSLVYLDFLQKNNKSHMISMVNKFGPVEFCDFLSGLVEGMPVAECDFNSLFRNVLQAVLGRVDALNKSSVEARLVRLLKDFGVFDIGQYFKGQFLDVLIESRNDDALALFARLISGIKGPKPAHELLGCSELWLPGNASIDEGIALENSYKEELLSVLHKTPIARALSFSLKNGNSSAFASLASILGSFSYKYPSVLVGLLDLPDELKEAIGQKKGEVVDRYCAVVDSFIPQLNGGGMHKLYQNMHSVQLKSSFFGDSNTKEFEAFKKVYPEIANKYRATKKALKLK